MLNYINLQLFADGDANQGEVKDQNLEKQPETKSAFGSMIRSAFGLKDKEQPKDETKQPETKPDEKPKEEKKPEESKPDEVKKPDATDDKAKQDPEFYEIPYMKDKDGKQQTVKIPAAERDSYLQKGYNYDRVKERADNANATLQRIAKTEGFKSVDEYLADLDNREKSKLAEKIEEAAGDPDKINEIIDERIKAHPKVIETQEKDRTNDYKDIKAELSKDKFFKELEPKLDEIMAQNPTADVRQAYNVYKVIRSDFLTPEKLSEFVTKEKESAVTKTIADIHDKERRATPTGGDANDGSEELARPTSIMSDMAKAFGVSANKVAQRIAKTKNKK